MQERADLPEEDPDTKGGGQVHDEHRVAKAEDVGDQGLVPGEDPIPAAADSAGGGAGAAGGVKVEAGAMAGAMAAASLETSEALKGGSRGSPTPPANPNPAPVDASEPIEVDKAAPTKGMMDLLGDDGDI